MDPLSQPCASAGRPASQPFLRQGEQAAAAISYPSGVAGEEKPNKSGHHLLTTAKSLPGLMASVSARGRDGGRGSGKGAGDDPGHRYAEKDDVGDVEIRQIEL